MSRLNRQRTTTEEIHALDVINAINDAIRRVISEAIRNRTAETLVVEQTVVPTIDTTKPYVVSAALDRPIFSTPPIELAVYNTLATVYSIDVDTATEAQDRVVGFSGNDLYVCVKAFDDGVKAKSTGKLRSFTLNDGGLYFEGEVITHMGNFYQVNEDFTNNGVEVEEPLFTQVFWLKIAGEKNHRPTVHPVNRLSSIAIVDQYGAIAVNANKLYATPNLKSVTIEYVPEWVDVQELSTELALPAEWEAQIKDLATQTAAIKLGMAQNEDS